MYTFHKTVRGYLHILRGDPCEDSSLSYTAANGTFHIVIIADGHGSSSCFRSAKGSEVATSVMYECLKQFAETVLGTQESERDFYQKIFSEPRYRRLTLKQLTDAIVAEWYDAVFEDYQNNPPSQDEMKLVSEKNVSNFTPHIYGTTVLAALMLPSCLILLHQGDGRCDVFYEDGSIDQPIPWDARCEGTVTTSLCDSDAAESFRSCVIDLNQKKVIACYLGSDGVEDAYRDTYEDLGGSHSLMGGVHTFYKDLSCHIASSDKFEFFEEYLSKMLPEFSSRGRFSRTGSGDDISIAGIVNVEALRPLVKNFELDVKEYSLEEELSLRKAELASKMRKHAFLRETLDKAQIEYKKVEPFIALFDQLKHLEEERLGIIDQINALMENLKDLKTIERELKEYFSYRNAYTLSQTTKGYLADLQKQFERNWFTEENIFKKITTDIDKTRTEGSKTRSKLDTIEVEIKKIQKIVSNAPEEAKALEQKFKDAEAEFREYDAKYQAISNDKVRIQNELDELRALRKQNEEK